MFREDFVERMGSSFAAKKNEEKKAEYLNQLNIFANKCPENHLSSMYNFAVSYDKYPSVKALFKHARESGFIVEDKAYVSKQVWYYSCNGFYRKIPDGEDKNGKLLFKLTKFSCKTEYSSKSQACPNCGSTSGTIVLLRENETLPVGLKSVQAQCYICSKYKPDDKGDGFRVYGPGCGIHGNFNSPENDEQCKSCSCRACCTDSKNYRYNQSEYFFNKDGERKDIPQEWLKHSRRPGEEIIDFGRLIKR